ncbi:hypothetical protein D9615_010211 [Tricholomella constricta]|uniref:Uncharacterized protein n=1 Tax=Tricholomella constricta TaxID=117010 RepID=A0A8H5LSV5_9AGAR|nr:hypothetical protein D9615_010211 [Tricholomella constricta]
MPTPHGVERCADILLSMREEISEAGNFVAGELAAPIEKPHRILRRSAQIPPETVHIHACDDMLTAALRKFGFRIQVRILKQLQAVDARRAKDTQRILEEIAKMSPVVGPTPPMEMEKTVMAASLSRLRESQILPALKTLHASQDTVQQRTVQICGR